MLREHSIEVMKSKKVVLEMMNDTLLMHHWHITKAPDGSVDHITFRGSLKEFNEWKLIWKMLIPKCPDFECRYRTQNCGNLTACATASEFNVASSGVSTEMCHCADCDDCVHQEKCAFGILERERRGKYELSFVLTPPYK